MIPPIILILANDMGQGMALINNCKLDPDSCAVINEPSYFDHIRLKPNELIYAHAEASSELFDKLNERLVKDGNKTINLKIINP